MMAIIASRPLLISARRLFSFLSLSSMPLQPARPWDLGEGSETIGDVLKLEAHRRGTVPWPLEVLGHYVANAYQHRHAAVLELNRPAALELCHGDVRSVEFAQLQRIPESK